MSGHSRGTTAEHEVFELVEVDAGAALAETVCGQFTAVDDAFERSAGDTDILGGLGE